MHVNKVCNIEDFAEMAISDVHRKAWEVSLAVHTMKTNLTRKNPRVLGVGAGKEPTIFIMTGYADVHATDLYADAGMWHRDAPADMLIDPARCAPAGIDWVSSRLVVQHMDARKLRYPDGYFDAVFSSSSIEHFGSLADIARAAREIGRVLRPGGIATISTEYKIGGPDGHGWDGVTVFDEETLHRYIIDASGLELIEPLNLVVSESTLATAFPLSEAVHLVSRGQELPRPHIVVTHQGYTFTSVHLALRKAKE